MHTKKKSKHWYKIYLKSFVRSISTELEKEDSEIIEKKMDMFDQLHPIDSMVVALGIGDGKKNKMMNPSAFVFWLEEFHETFFVDEKT